MSAEAFVLVGIVGAALAVAWMFWSNQRTKVDEATVEQWKKELRLLDARYASLENKSDSEIIAALAVPVSIPLDADEVGIHETRGVVLFEARTSRIYGGGRVMRGVYIGASDPVEMLRQIDTGTLTCTNRRLVFVGDLATRSVKLRDLVSVKPVGNCIEVARNGNGKVETYQVDNPLIWTVHILASKGGKERADAESQAQMPTVNSYSHRDLQQEDAARVSRAR